MPLHRPIGIFDAGIGSYAIVKRVRTHFPRQDVIYFADRASFPYGAKTPDELLASVKSASEFLINQGCVAIILASNAPSIVVLDALQAVVSIPVIGVFPPVREAIERSRSKHVAILGVQSMIISDALQAYVKRYQELESQVSLINASSLVDLVENFDFLNHPHTAQEKVSQFMHRILRVNPHIDVITLSSTHLPWLRPFFESTASDVLFLDPADEVLEKLVPYTSDSQGHAIFIATETPLLSLAQFNIALQSLGATEQAFLKNDIQLY